MKKLTISMTPEETKRGWIYFAFQMTLLQFLLAAFNYAMGGILSDSALNAVYFALNFFCNILIFYNFLDSSTKTALKKPGTCFLYALLGFSLYWLSSMVVVGMIRRVYPAFTNVNDASIVTMMRESPILITVCVVGLAPLAEELVFRGLIFRPLYNRKPWLGYCVSAICFSLPHVLTYLGRHDPIVLLLCFIQYLPAGFCLGWAYARSQTIWTPVLIHTAVNLVGVLVMR